MERSLVPAQVVHPPIGIKTLKCEFSKLEQEYGIRIYVSPEDYFPSLSASMKHKWFTEGPKAAAEFDECLGYPLSFSEAQGVLPVTKDFLSAYPRKIIQRDLKDMGWVTGLKCNSEKHFGIGGLLEGGSKGRFFIAYRHEQCDDMLRTAHHELNHIFVEKHRDRFPEEEWKKLGHKDVRKRKRLIGEFSNFPCHIPLEKTLREGWVTLRSVQQFEEDIAILASWWSTCPNKVKEWRKKFDLINSKCALLKQFYENIA